MEPALSDRLTAARNYVAGKPTDRFGLYALAMELRKTKEFEESFATFETLIQHHPNYGAAFYHYGLARRESGDRDGCIAVLQRGLAACKASRDGKTEAEIEEVLDELGAL